jgi:hypothetical protein
MKKRCRYAVAKDAAKAGIGKARDAGTAEPVKMPLAKSMSNYQAGQMRVSENKCPHRHAQKREFMDFLKEIQYISSMFILFVLFMCREKPAVHPVC